MTKAKTYKVKLVKRVISNANIKVKAKSKAEAMRLAREEIEDCNVDWFFDREQFKIDVK